MTQDERWLQKYNEVMDFIEKKNEIHHAMMIMREGYTAIG